ncbi:MAG: HAMP domain-containing protein, partial [Spirochaetota bacterium]
EGNIYVVAYIDPLRGGDMRVYQREARGWVRLTNAENQFATFPTAAVINERVHIFWHGRQGSEPELPTRIVYLEPDQRVDPPIVEGVNFDIGSRSPRDTAAFAWTPRPDASGVVGYKLAWSRDDALRLPEGGEVIPSTQAEFPADTDGPWYLHIRASDRAGNWSEQTTVRYFRDTTPPAAVTFDQPPIDEEGYLASNTFTITWQPPEVDVSGGSEIVSGYVTDLTYVAPADAPAELVSAREVTTPSLEEFTDRAVLARDNYDDGLWALTVSAVDSVGNVGEPAALYMRLNKYVPVTLITTIAAVPDPLGRYALDIVGRGFTANGMIDRVIVDEDGRPPFDYVYERGSPGYRIFSDRAMTGPILDNLETGEYFIGLDHSERGITFSSRRLSIERNGTVKFGNYTILGAPTFAVDGFEFPVLTPVNALAWAIIALLIAVSLFSGTRAVAIAREGAILRSEARALITGGPLLLERRERRINAMKRQGIGLRLKFAFFIVLLVISIVGGVAVGLGTATLNRQRQVLVSGLKDRVDVLLESMVAGAVDPLSSPDLQVVDLEQLPESTRAMQEALYATVTGQVSALAGEGFADSFNYVWGTNDPILQAAGVADAEVREALLEAEAAGGVARTPIPDDSALFLGRTLLDDSATSNIELMGAVVERLARARVNALVLERQITFEEIDVLRQEITAVEFRGGDVSDLELQRQRGRLTLNSLNQQIDNTLQQAILDAATLVRWLSVTGSNARSYVVPDDDTALTEAIEEARDALETNSAQRQLAQSPVLSVPQFIPTEFDTDVTDHIFYQVVAEPNAEGLPSDPQALAQLDAQDLSITYFRGAVRLGVSTDLIVETIADARRDIVQITLLIALAASAAGVFGALLLATIVVIPINKVVNAVEEIRKTKDKTTLEDRPIDVKSRDELYRLADAINAMSRGLKTAAIEEENLRATSELQKMFIPLVQTHPNSPNAKKLTSGSLDHDLLEFYGYYEGADDLSGDYFAY